MFLPPFAVFPELMFENLLLREVKPDDISNLLEVLTYDGKKAETLEDGIEITKKINADYEKGDGVNWVIENCSTKELVGVIGYCRGFKDETGELGCILKAEFRGKGLMSAALRLAAEFGLNQLKLRQVTAITHAENSKAIALLTRNAFQQTEQLENEGLKFVYFPLQSTI